MCTIESVILVSPSPFLALVGQAATPSNSGTPIVVWVFVAVLITSLAIAILFNTLILRKWLQLRMAGVSATLIDLVVLPLRGVQTAVVVEASLELSAAGASVSFDRMAQLYIANKSRIRTPSDLVELYRVDAGREDSELS